MSVLMSATSSYGLACLPAVCNRIEACAQLDLEGEKTGRQEKTAAGSSGADLPYDGGESDLGRASHSRRTAHAGLPGIRAKSLPLDEASSEGSPASPALARLSSESQGSDCGHRLLHRAHDQLRRPLLLLCHPPRSPAYPAFQHHEASDKRLDHPAAARGVSLRGAPRFLIHDRDAKYGTEVPAAIR